MNNFTSSESLSDTLDIYHSYRKFTITITIIITIPTFSRLYNHPNIYLSRWAYIPQIQCIKKPKMLRYPDKWKGRDVHAYTVHTHSQMYGTGWLASRQARWMDGWLWSNQLTSPVGPARALPVKIESISTYALWYWSVFEKSKLRFEWGSAGWIGFGYRTHDSIFISRIPISSYLVI